MNREQYLLTCLAEECAEVAHRCSKAIRFGLEEKQREQGKTNAERLGEELRDLFSVVEMLNDQGFTDIKMDDKNHIIDKILKVECYIDYSRGLGRVE